MVSFAISQLKISLTCSLAIIQYCVAWVLIKWLIAHSCMDIIIKFLKWKKFGLHTKSSLTMNMFKMKICNSTVTFNWVPKLVRSRNKFWLRSWIIKTGNNLGSMAFPIFLNYIHSDSELNLLYKNRIWIPL